MVSKIPTTIVSSICLLSIITNVVPSNPDTEIVQDTVEEGKSPEKKSVNIRSAEDYASLAVITDRYSGVKILRPYFTDMGIIWKEVLTAPEGEKIRIRDRGTFLDITRVYRYNRTSPFITQPPGGYQTNVKGPNTGRNGNVPYGYVLNGNGPSGNVPNGNGPNGNVPNGNGYNGNVLNGNWPNGNVPNGYVSNGNGPNGNVPNGNGPNGNVPNGYVPNGNGPNGNVPDGRVKGELDETTPRGENGRSPPPRNYQNKFRGTPPSTTDSGRISPDANLFAGIVNDFTFKMMEKIKIESNFVVSPLSIFTALSMCYLGAGGRTKAQLQQILGLDEYAVHGVTLHQGISDLLSMISPKSLDYELFLANGLFFGRNFTVEEPFKEDLRNFYAAELKNLDFGDQQTCLRTINEWVGKKTMDTIPTLIDSPLPVHTKLVLLNAIFFKGLWETPFPLDGTYNASFFDLNGSEMKVPFMNMYRGTFPFHRSEEHQHYFIKLPYKGDQVSMIIALPFGRRSVPMPSVTDQALCHIQDAMTDVQLGVTSIPRFRLEYLLSLKEPLERMGLNSLFDQSVNLTAMRKENDISVSEILHKAVIDVHEKGTTASATTEVQVAPLSGQGDNFVANHPYAFYVVHEASGLVLFHGKKFDFGENPPSHKEVNKSSNRNEGNSGPQGNRWKPYPGRRRV